MKKGTIGYWAHQMSILALLVTNNMYYNSKSTLSNFISIRELTWGNIKFALIMNHPLK